MDVNALVVLFLIIEYACDGRLGTTWGKRTSIDASRETEEGVCIYNEEEEGERKRRWVAKLLASIYQRQFVISYAQGVTRGGVVVWRFCNREKSISFFLSFGNTAYTLLLSGRLCNFGNSRPLSYSVTPYYSLS